LATDPAKEHAVRQTVNQVLGILVFLVGVALLALVFASAYQLYVGIGGDTLGSVPQTQVAEVSGTPHAAAPTPGTVKTLPGADKPLTTVLALFGAKLLALLVMGWLAGLLASKGAAMTRLTVIRHE
jgi:hypothetical protein